MFYLIVYPNFIKLTFVFMLPQAISQVKKNIFVSLNQNKELISMIKLLIMEEGMRKITERLRSSKKVHIPFSFAFHQARGKYKTV